MYTRDTYEIHEVLPVFTLPDFMRINPMRIILMSLAVLLFITLVATIVIPVDSLDIQTMSMVAGLH